MVGKDAAWEERRRRFGELISAELYARLWRQAAWLTSCREDAEDLLQDSLATALRRLHQLRDDSQVLPWLMRIMRNRFLNMMRSERRRRSRKEAARRTDVAGTSGLADSESEVELTRDALERLKPDERWLLTMHYIEDVETRELSKTLMLGEAAVRKRLSRARRALKRLIGELQGSDKSGR